MQVILVVFLLVMALFAVSRLVELTANGATVVGSPLLFIASFIFWGAIAAFTGLFGAGYPILMIHEWARDRRERRETSLHQLQKAEEQASRVQALDEARSRIIVAGARSLTDAEVANARVLASQGTADAMLLVSTALASADATPADISAIFSSDVLKFLAESAAPECWPRAVACFAAIEPCLGLFAAHMNQALPSLIDGVPGYCKQADSRTRPYQCYRTLLENEFPRHLMEQIEATLNERLSAQWPGYVGQGSPPHTVYAFAGRLITRLSSQGARILAALPSMEDLKDFGAYLILSRLTQLDDEVAGLMADARRSILFGRLRSFPATPGHIALAKRLARQDKVVLGPTACVAPAVGLILAGKLTSVSLSESDIELSELIGNYSYPPT